VATGGDVVNEPSKWDDADYGPMSLETIRLLFQPESRHRVSWNSYPVGGTVSGWSRAGRRYIVTGACRIEVGDRAWELRAGECLDEPEGDFRLSVSAESPVEFIFVWELPEEIQTAV
jgi:hypothetical protein